MAKGRRVISRDIAHKQVASNLVNALKFIAVAQSNESDNPNETHCIIGQRTAVAFNGILAAGHFIDEDLNCCPHTKRLIDALERCGTDLAITADPASLSLRSERFRVTIPCIPQGALQHINPDPPVAQIDDIIKEGFKHVSCIVADASEYVITASILLRAGSMVSTNRHVMLEYWHGFDLPPGLAIPKAAAMAVVKAPKKLTGLGFSDHSVTFWFEGQAWIRTQRYREEWPDVSRILDKPADAKSLPALFFAGINAVMPFCEEESIYLTDKGICSDLDEFHGAGYLLDGLPIAVCFNPKYLKLVEPFMKTVDWASNEGQAYFFGDRIRGVIMGKNK